MNYNSKNIIQLLFFVLVRLLWRLWIVFEPVLAVKQCKNMFIDRKKKTKRNETLETSTHVYIKFS